MDLQVKNLTKTFKDADRDLTIIKDVTYSFPKSGSMAIVGRSGIGKSTLLHLLGGLDRPTLGEVFCDGKDIAKFSDNELALFRSQNIGFVFQFSHLLPEFNAVENVALPLIIAGHSEIAATKKADEVLDRVGLSARRAHRPGQLSGGEQQRVAIARAVVTKPKLLLADEPTGSLDVETEIEVRKLLLELNAESGSIMIVVTHDRDLAASLDTVLEMLPGGELVLV